MNLFLSTMEYPCTREDLVREALRAGMRAEADALSVLRDRSYHGSRDVLVALPASSTDAAGSVDGAFSRARDRRR